MLDFQSLRTVNVNRCVQSFHALKSWSPTDWACAVAGEVGEACNLIKKMRRIEATESPFNAAELRGHTMSDRPCPKCGDLDGCHIPGKIKHTITNMKLNIGKELADAIIYIDLLAARLEIDLRKAVTDKFNGVSRRVGSDLTL